MSHSTEFQKRITTHPIFFAEKPFFFGDTRLGNFLLLLSSESAIFSSIYWRRFFLLPSQTGREKKKG